MIASTPSRTAYRVALRRAAHQRVDGDPLVFTDPFAERILGREGADALAHVPSAERKPFSAGMRAWVVARARFAEDTLAQQAIKSRPLQYLVLGAGLDTFALRNPYPAVRVFEVDHPATQAWKCDRLGSAQLRLPASASLVPVDFETQSLHHELSRAGFDWNVRTVIAWLGVVPYLSPGAFHTSCQVLSGLRGGAHLVFDYSQPREVLSPVEQLMHDSLASRVAQAGEPFRLFFTPDQLREELHRHNFRVEEDLGSAQLNERYFQDRIDGLRTRGSAGRLCHASLPRA